MAPKHRLLIVTHGLGGGVERHISDLRALLSGLVDTEILRSVDTETVSHETSVAAPVFWRFHEWIDVVDAIRQRKYDWISFHHIHGFPSQVLKLAYVLALPYDLTIHDFYSFCPIYSLSTVAGHYCGEPDLAGCAACTGDRPNAWGWSIERWRNEMGQLLAGATRITAPSRFVADRIQVHFPATQPTVWPHPPRLEWIPVARPAAKIVLIGGLSRVKGLEALLACAAMAQEHGLALSFCVLGYTESAIPELLKLPIQVRGEYADCELPKLLANERADVIWFPGQIPETYSYTLDVALASGLPIVASKLGAIEERLTGRLNALLIDANAVPKAWCDALLAAAEFPPEANSGSMDSLALMARNDYRAKFAAPIIARPENFQAIQGAFHLPGGINLLEQAPLRPDLPLTVMFEHGVECGHMESRAALKSKLIEVERDYAVLAGYSEPAGIPWFELLRRAETQAELVKQRDSEVEQLRSALVVVEHESEILRHESEALQGETDILRRESETLRTDILNIVDQLEQATASHARAMQRINELESSTSWRVTAPLRSLSHFGKKLNYRGYRLVFLMKHAATRIPLAWKILLSDGFGALWRRVETKLGARQFAPTENLSATLAPIGKLQLNTCATNTLPRVSIVIPVYGHDEHTFNCLSSLAAHTALDDVEIIVVDDASPNPTAEMLSGVRGALFLRANQNGGFIESCRIGAENARGEFLILLNNDVQATSGWLESLLDVFQLRSDAGLVGARLVYPNGRLQEAGGIVWQDGSAWNWGRDGDPDRPEYRYLRAVDYCSGACLAMRMTDWRYLGGFDAAYAPAYYEDTDLAFRVRQIGKKVYYQPNSTIIHFEGISSGTDESAGIKRHQVINRASFLARWKQVLRSHRSNGLMPQREVDRGANARVLVVEACMITPDQDSGSVRMLAMLELLIELECKVSFIADNLEYRQPYVHQLQQAGVEVWHHPFVTSVAQLLTERGKEYDAIIFCRHYIAARYLEDSRRWAPQAKIVFDTVDLHYLREQRLAELEGSRTLLESALTTREQELGVIARSDLTLVVSPVEQNLLAQALPSASVNILSNIHETRSPTQNFADRSGLIFVGGFQHPPNIDAMLWFVGEVWPIVQRTLADVTLTIVGSKMPASIRELSAPNVIIAGFVEDLDPLLDSTRISVAPLRYGAGVKGKINQAMACGLPVVATITAAEGMDLHDGEDLLIAESPETFASAIVRLYSDETLWNRLAGGGQRNIRQHFSRARAKQTLAGILGVNDPDANTSPIDVIVPVYGQINYVQSCIQSVLAEPQQTPYELIVIDDASPDMELREWLDEQAAGGRLKLYRNAENLGFVASVNFGMTLHPDRNVVLLNSDTQVHGDWLDRLHTASRSQNNVGTVTPWSNNATICSFPKWPDGAELPDSLSLSFMDTLAASCCRHSTVPIPTAVGFCMYIRRRCLNEIGLFDQSAFGHGYGEENDFCLRAEQLGYTHLLAADTYVYHAGNASFGGASADLKVTAGAVIRERWPDYESRIQRFVASDPLLPLRRKLDNAIGSKYRS